MRMSVRMRMKRASDDGVEVTDRIKHLLRFIDCSRVWFSEWLWDRYVVVPEWVTGESEGTRAWDIIVQNPYLRVRPHAADGEQIVSRYYVESYPNDPRARDADGTPIPAGLWVESILKMSDDGTPPRLAVLLVAEVFPARIEGERLTK